VIKDQQSENAQVATKYLTIQKAIEISALFYVFFISAWILVHLLDLDASTSFLAVQVIAWALTLFVVLRIMRTPWRISYPLKPIAGQIVFPLIIASLGASVVLGELAGMVPMPESLQKFFESMMGENRTASFLAAVVVAPLAEEFYFRGWMLQGFLGRYSKTRAVLASATIFALFHLNPWQAVGAFLFGIASAWLFMRTGSLIPSIVSHAVGNSSWFLYMSLLSRMGYKREMLEEMEHLPWPVVTFSLVILVVGAIWLSRLLKRDTLLAPIDETPSPNGSSMGSG